ncbi:MAG: hypothetical protein B7Z60_09875, partial [Ferrovum sp. 37-45-19]
MVDDYSGYKSIFGPAVTEQALTWFAKLYEAERAWKGLGVEERARKRH